MGAVPHDPDVDQLGKRCHERVDTCVRAVLDDTSAEIGSRLLVEQRYEVSVSPDAHPDLLIIERAIEDFGRMLAVLVLSQCIPEAPIDFCDFVFCLFEVNATNIDIEPIGK